MINKYEREYISSNLNEINQYIEKLKNNNLETEREKNFIKDTKNLANSILEILNNFKKFKLKFENIEIYSKEKLIEKLKIDYIESIKDTIKIYQWREDKIKNDNIKEKCRAYIFEIYNKAIEEIENS